MHDGRRPERWVFILDIRADGPISPAIIARRLLKVLLRRWGIKCKGLSIDRRMYDLEAENKRLQGIIDGMAARIGQQNELLANRAERRQDSRLQSGKLPERVGDQVVVDANSPEHR